MESLGREIQIHATVHRSSPPPLDDLHHPNLPSHFRHANHPHRIRFDIPANIHVIRRRRPSGHHHRRADAPPPPAADPAAGDAHRPERGVAVVEGGASAAELKAAEVHVVNTDVGDEGHVEGGRAVTQVPYDDVRQAEGRGLDSQDDEAEDQEGDA